MCNDPAPGADMDASEAVEYIRGDVVNELYEALEQMLNTQPGYSDERNAAITSAEIALAKARGQ